MDKTKGIDENVEELILKHVTNEVICARINNDDSVCEEIQDMIINLINKFKENRYSVKEMKNLFERISFAFDFKNISTLDFNEESFLETDNILTHHRNIFCRKIFSSHIIDTIGIGYFLFGKYHNGEPVNNFKRSEIRFNNPLSTEKMIVIGDDNKFTGEIVLFFEVSEKALDSKDVFIKRNYCVPVMELSYDTVVEGKDSVISTIAVYHNDIDFEGDVKYKPVFVYSDKLKGIDIHDKNGLNAELYTEILNDVTNEVKEKFAVGK